MTRHSAVTLAVVVATVGAVVVQWAPLAADASARVPLELPTQAMDGNLVAAPGSTLEAGYDFTMPGKHSAAKVSISRAQVTFAASCGPGPGDTTVTVPITSASYVVPANDGKDWFPTSDQQDPASYEGSVVVPNVCGGANVSFQQGGTFYLSIASTDTTDPLNLRWHYAVANQPPPGNWSPTAQVFPISPGTPLACAPPWSACEIVVKVDAGYPISQITAAFPVALDPGGLPSRGIYLVHPTTTQYQDQKQLPNLAKQISSNKQVVYAIPNAAVELADTQFSGWHFGNPVPVRDDTKLWSDQKAATELQLAEAHAMSTGTGVTVAVLDTGADPTQPVLQGRLLPGWNYVDDSPNTNDVPTRGRGGNGNGAVGHGTFVSGLVALVAPGAKIIPDRVLDSDGYGTIYGVAQAIEDAVAAGANVINMSFGTADQMTSPLIQDAIQQAQQAGVIVVAATGNDGDNQPHWPAALPQTLSVSALDTSCDALASFSDWGPWADVAAPGQKVVGPMPHGRFATWAGTSMAAPFVSGQAALLLSYVPGITGNQVTQAIEQTTTSLQKNTVHFGTIGIVASLEFAQSHGK